MSTFRQLAAFRLRGAYLTMHRRFNAQFEPIGITADQYVILSLLKDLGECTQRQLADLSYANVNTVAAMLRLLEKKKRVRRRPHAKDGRAMAVTLTAAGEELVKTCNKHSMELQTAVEQCFPRETRSSLLAALDSLAEQMVERADP